MKPQLTVAIITFNEERNIARCIDSVRDIADEVLVLDSFSKDGTQQIAEERGARFETHAFDGHIQQKNRAWQMATHEWVLSLDADEALDDTLREEVRAAVDRNDPEIDGYRMNRLTNYCGKWVHHSGWYPDTKTRLFRKGRGEWKGINPHDRFDLHEPSRGRHLNGDILHYSYYTAEDHYKQIEYFSKIAATELHRRGKTIALPMIWAKVVAQFVKTYFLKLGLLDGATGFTIARRSAFATYRKYSILKALNADENS